MGNRENDIDSAWPEGSLTVRLEGPLEIKQSRNRKEVSSHELKAE